MRDKIRAAINTTANCIHNATEWDDPYYADASGRTLMDQLIDKIVDVAVNRREPVGDVARAPSCFRCGSLMLSPTTCMECDFG